MLINGSPGKFSFFDGLADPGNDSGNITGQAEHVVSCDQRLHGGLTIGVIFADTLHLQRIGEGESIETKLLPQQPGYISDRYRSGPVGGVVNDRNGQMRHHHTADTTPDEFTEGV